MNISDYSDDGGNTSGDGNNTFESSSQSQSQSNSLQPLAKIKMFNSARNDSDHEYELDHYLIEFVSVLLVLTSIFSIIAMKSLLLLLIKTFCLQNLNYLILFKIVINIIIIYHYYNCLQ